MVYPEKKPINPKKVGGWIAIAVVLVVLISVSALLYTIVPVGHTGVIVSLGSVADNVLVEGFHLKAPWQNIIFIDNRAQREKVVTEAFSADILPVDVDFSINYSIDRVTSQTLYKSVGTGYYATVMLPRILENLKATFSKYSAENLVSSRATLSLEIKDKLVTEFKPYGIEVLSVAIENLTFSSAFNAAVESKQVAEQTLLKTKIEQEERLMVEKTTAERAIVTANADAEVARINADAAAYRQKVQAEAEAEANKLLAESITRELIDYVQANNWDGALPRFSTGGSEIRPVISLGSEELEK